METAFPTVLGIVVGVERNGEASSLHFPKQLRHLRPQSALQIERREMQMPRIRKIVEVEILKRQVRNGSRICHHVAPSVTLQCDGDSSLNGVRDATYSRNIDRAPLQRLQRSLTQIVVSNARLKSNPAPHGREIVRPNRRRSSQGEHHPIRQQFPLPRKSVG